MDETCCSVPSAGAECCELPSTTVHRSTHARATCPACGKKGKPVQGQTVKAMLSATLREIRDTDYLFCRTRDCPVVYFTADGTQWFTTDQERERVYQKEPEAEDVFVCYCFRHTVGDVTRASANTRTEILNDIDSGIQAD